MSYAQWLDKLAAEREAEGGCGGQACRCMTRWAGTQLVLTRMVLG